MSSAARTAPICASPTTPALWADPVMGSWRRLDRALASAAANPASHYEGRLRSAVGRLERAAPQVRRNDRLHGVELLCRIATRIDFSGRQSGVSQPQRHLTDVLRCLQDDAPLAGERLIEELFDEGSNRRHDCLPSAMNSSPAAATSRMRSAVASRYQ